MGGWLSAGCGSGSRGGGMGDGVGCSIRRGWRRGVSWSLRRGIAMRAIRSKSHGRRWTGSRRSLRLAHRFGVPQPPPPKMTSKPPPSVVTIYFRHMRCVAFGLGQGARSAHTLMGLQATSNAAPGQMRRNPKGGRSFSARLRCSLLADPCGYARRSRLVWPKNPLPRMCRK